MMSTQTFGGEWVELVKENPTQVRKPRMKIHRTKGGNLLTVALLQIMTQGQLKFARKGIV